MVKNNHFGVLAEKMRCLQRLAESLQRACRELAESLQNAPHMRGRATAPGVRPLEDTANAWAGPCLNKAVVPSPLVGRGGALGSVSQ